MAEDEKTWKTARDMGEGVDYELKGREAFRGREDIHRRREDMRGCGWEWERSQRAWKVHGESVGVWKKACKVRKVHEGSVKAWNVVRNISRGVDNE